MHMANQKAARVSAMVQAKGYFERAMEILDTLPNTLENRELRISLLAEQGEVFLFLLESKQHHELLLRYEPLLEETKNPSLRVAFYASLAALEYLSGHLDRAIHLAEGVVEPCRNLETSKFSAYVYYPLIAGLYQRGELERAVSTREEALRGIGSRFAYLLYAGALFHISLALSWLGRWEEAASEGKEIMKIGHESSNKYLIGIGAWALSQAWAMKGDSDRAVKFAELMVETATLPQERGNAQLVHGYALCKSGMPDKGIDLMAPTLQLFSLAGAVVYEWHFGAFLADGYLLAGRYDEAIQTAEKVVQSATVGGARPWLGFAQRVLGEVALKTKPREAERYFEKAIPIFKEIKADNFLALAYSGMGRYQKKQGNMEQARKYLTDALEIFERLGTVIEPDKVKKQLAELPVSA